MEKTQGHNIYSFLVLKLLLALFTLLLMQGAFYLCNSHILRPEGNEWYGLLLGNLVFSSATVATFLLPYFLMMLLPFGFRQKKGYRITAEVLYILTVLLIIIPRGANAAYYQYTYRLLSDEIFSYLGISGQMGSLAPHFAVDYWYAWVAPLVVFLLFLFLNSRIRPLNNKHLTLNAKHLILTTLSALVLWFLVRGGFGKFIQPEDAADYCQPKNTALVNNDAYNIFRTLFTPELREVHYMSDEEANQLCPVVFTPLPIAPWEDTEQTTSRNVVLIVVESLGQEFMGCYNTQPDADTRTPFLDSLAQYCTLYDGRANGKKSIEGILAINTSIPNLMAQPFVSSPYGNDDFTGLPAIFKRHGYHTAFYHGTYNGVMNFDQLCAKIGFDEYLGKNEYEAEGLGRPEDYDGAWGILDEPFLQYTVRHINDIQGPFFAEIFTVSSHHPYPIPDEHKERFLEGRHPILKCVEYTDHALRRFFDEARKQPWFDSTLFIITADHSGHGLSPEYNDYDGWYRIPMMVFDPQHPEGSRNALIVQQIDLFPSLIDLFRFDEQFITFGNTIGRLIHVGNQVYFGNGYYCLVSNDINDTTQHRIAVIQGHYEEGTEIELRYLKALIQQYNNRVINNKLIAP